MAAVKEQSVRWEYREIYAGDSLSDKLNEAGADGWEAVVIDSYRGLAWLKLKRAVK